MDTESIENGVAKGSFIIQSVVRYRNGEVDNGAMMYAGYFAKIFYLL